MIVLCSIMVMNEFGLPTAANGPGALCICGVSSVERERERDSSFFGWLVRASFGHLWH